MRYSISRRCAGLPLPQPLRTPKRLELVGPRYFGRDLDFRPFTPHGAR